MNFKQETLEKLEDHNKTWDDVEFVQGNDFVVKNSKEEILELMDFEYDDGYGGAEIARDLVIVGKDWWLERHEYDGSEWWEYKELPEKLTVSKEIERFAGDGWGSLKGINDIEEIKR